MSAEKDQNDPTFDTVDISVGAGQPALIDEDEVTASGEVQYLHITVEEPHKVGEGMGSYVVYQVVFSTNMMTIFMKDQSKALRRFSDFLGLHEKLVQKYIKQGCIIPPPPEKQAISTAKIKIGGSNQNREESSTNNEFLEIRRAALERFLNRIAAHPVLKKDKDFIEFLETTDDLPKAASTATLSGAGVMRLFNKVGETVNKITYRMDENDPWFTEKTLDIEENEVFLQKLHSAAKLMCLNRKELSLHTGTVAKSAAVLSGAEEHNGLSRALSQLATVEEKVELLRSEVSNSDLFILSEQVKDYVTYIGAVKDILHERVKIFQTWVYAQQQLSKKRENQRKLESAGRTELMENSNKDIDDWVVKVNRAQKEFENVSVGVKGEIERFDQQKVQDVQSIFIKYFEDQMAHQNQLMGLWQSYVNFANEVV